MNKAGGFVTALSLLALVMALTALPGQARAAEKLHVVTTLPILAGIAQEIGGDVVEVKALGSNLRDPHKLVAKPTYKMAARKAQLYIELGLGLDIWGNDVVNASGNTAIQTGQPGHVIASTGIATKELPATLSRAWGDIHPYGNPHVWLDPINAKQLARNIRAGLVAVDPAHRQAYDERLQQFEKRVNEALYGKALIEEYGVRKLDRLSTRGRLMKHLKRKGTLDKLGGWLAKTAPLRGRKIVTYHKTWIYFASRFGMQIMAELEEKPGIPPSQNYLAQLVERMKKNDVKIILMASFYPSGGPNYVAEKTGAVRIRHTIDLDPKKQTYVSFMDDLVDQVVRQAK